MLVFLTHKLALPILKIIRKPEIFPYSKDELHALSENTMGYTLIRFLEERSLPLLQYYARHDMKHILLEYETTDEGEVCLQCFMLGNRHISFPVIATVVFGLVLMPEHWLSLKKAFIRGIKCVSISNWKWSEIIENDLAELKGHISLLK
jgi:ubiquinone biosynthesis protein Coq4